MAWGAALQLAMQAGSSAMNWWSQQQTNYQSLEAAREQMAFQERMSNTARQREVKDLISAGLNPILSANGGASSPQGAMAQLGAPQISDSNSALMANTPMRAKELREKEANIKAIIQQRNTARSQEEVNDFNSDLINDTRLKTQAETAQIRLLTPLLMREKEMGIINSTNATNAQVNQANAQANNLTKQSEMLGYGVNTAKAVSNFGASKFGKALPYILGAGALMPFGGGASRAAKGSYELIKKYTKRKVGF